MNMFDSIGFNFDMLCHTYMLRNYKSYFYSILCYQEQKWSFMCCGCVEGAAGSLAVERSEIRIFPVACSIGGNWGIWAFRLYV
jgi:hypothetical protein